MQNYQPTPGEYIYAVADKIVAMANSSGRKTSAEFNGQIMTANPGDNADAIVRVFNDLRSARLSDRQTKSN